MPYLVNNARGTVITNGQTALNMAGGGFSMMMLPLFVPVLIFGVGLIDAAIGAGSPLNPRS